MNFGIGESANPAQKVIGLGNELHHAVFDTVVYHLHVVPGSTFTHVGHARLAIDFSRNGFQNWLHYFPGREIAPRHYAWAFTGTFFSSGNPHAQEAEALALECCRPSSSIIVVRVTAIDDQVALVQVGEQAFDYLIHYFTRWHQQHDGAWCFQRLQKFGLIGSRLNFAVPGFLI